MGSNCVLLVSVLFLSRYEREIILYLSNNNQHDVIESVKISR